MRRMRSACEAMAVRIKRHAVIRGETVAEKAVRFNFSFRWSEGRIEKKQAL